MYRDNRQISLAEFFQSPFGKLNENNRWVKIANMISWDVRNPLVRAAPHMHLL